MERVEKTLGIAIVRAGKNLGEISKEEKILPSPKARYCTRLSKIYPMQDYIGKDEATIYIGIRADEKRPGSKETKTTRVVYPLKELGINLALVYRIVKDKDLMPPNFFWKRVYDMVIQELGEYKWVIQELPQWVFDRTFAWRSRPNCYMCFYQRIYEWAGLLDNHPGLFSNAERMEQETGFEDDYRESKFYWIGQDKPLSYIRDNFDTIIQKRVDKISQLLLKRLQMELFTDALIDELEAAQTSCGLYCGK